MCILKRRIASFWHLFSHQRSKCMIEWGQIRYEVMVDAMVYAKEYRFKIINSLFLLWQKVFFSNIYDPTHRFSYRAALLTWYPTQMPNIFHLALAPTTQILRKSNCIGYYYLFWNGFLESSLCLAAGNCKMDHEWYFFFSCLCRQNEVKVALVWGWIPIVMTHGLPYCMYFNEFESGQLVFCTNYFVDIKYNNIHSCDKSTT